MKVSDTEFELWVRRSKIKWNGMNCWDIWENMALRYYVKGVSIPFTKKGSSNHKFPGTMKLWMSLPERYVKTLVFHLGG